MVAVGIWPEPRVRMTGYGFNLRSFLLFFYASGFMAAVFLGIMHLCDLGLRHIYGPNISCVSICNSQLGDLEGHFGSAFAILYVAIPFTDMAETVR